MAGLRLVAGYPGKLERLEQVMSMHRSVQIAILVAGISTLLAGCAEQDAEIKRLQTSNAAMAHDVGRFRRESTDCMRDLQKARSDLAKAQGETKGDADLVAELRQGMEALLNEKDALVKQQDEVSQQLLGVQKQLAESVRQHARSMKQIQELEEQINALSAELDQLRAAQGTSTNPQNK